MTTIPNDGVLPGLLGLKRVRSEDAVRQDFQGGLAPACADWLHRHLDNSYDELSNICRRVAGAAFNSIAFSVTSSGYFSFSGEAIGRTFRLPAPGSPLTRMPCIANGWIQVVAALHDPCIANLFRCARANRRC